MTWFKKLFGGRSEGNVSGSVPDMISCQDALDRVYEYLDNELVATEHERVAEHFRICQRCYPRLRFEEAFLQAVQRIEDGECSDDLKNRILEALHKEGLEPR